MSIVNLGKVRITFGGTFESTKSYDMLTVVDNPYKVKYISKIHVPVGSSLSDEGLWTPLSGAFVEQYQGDHSVVITTRVDGSTLKAGDLYYNSTSTRMAVYNGSVWENLSSTEDVNGISIAMAIALG